MLLAVYWLRRRVTAIANLLGKIPPSICYAFLSLCYKVNSKLTSGWQFLFTQTSRLVRQRSGRCRMRHFQVLINTQFMTVTFVWKRLSWPQSPKVDSIGPDVFDDNFLYDYFICTNDDGHFSLFCM